MNKDTQILDKKLRMYVMSIAMRHMPFGGNKWDSSAQNLENELGARGIKLPKKLFYEYKMPGGKTQDAFMDKYVMERFVANFFRTHGHAGEVLKDKKLTMSDKAKIFKYVWRNRGKYNDILKQYEMELRRLNPELANVRVDNSRSLVYGAMFGFAPDEISYFSDNTHRNYKQEQEVSDTLKNRFGINLSYVLAPKTAEMVINALVQNSRNKSKER